MGIMIIPRSSSFVRCLSAPFIASSTFDFGPAIIKGLELLRRLDTSTMVLPLSPAILTGRRDSVSSRVTASTIFCCCLCSHRNSHVKPTTPPRSITKFFVVSSSDASPSPGPCVKIEMNLGTVMISAIKAAASRPPMMNSLRRRNGVRASEINSISLLKPPSASSPRFTSSLSLLKAAVARSGAMSPSLRMVLKFKPHSKAARRLSIAPSSRPSFSCAHALL
mmetsp:Transcript_1935/g.6955  ORF Transcript_1935/g.6955 Transcript_1935/m.6955 type:complete len:222 (+) Transcript_1935:966-1631(+)